MIDNIQAIQTPEGVELNLSPAGPVNRALAWAIDFIIFILIISSIITVYAVLDIAAFENGIFYILLFFLWWFYPVYFEIKKHGSTPGKKVMGLRVLNDDGTPVTVGASMLRNLVLCVDFFPFLYGLGLVSMLLNSRFKRLGDLAAGTLVVHVGNETSGKPGSIPSEKSERPPLALDAEEQKAIVSFAERVREQTMPRNTELADILKDLTGEEGPAGVSKLLAYANSLIGRK
jgi:uncharacterized RDD family membrane protein YckC